MSAQATSILPVQQESWRPVVGYEGVYSVSDLGRVRRDMAGKGARAGYVLRQRIDKQTGYPRIGLVVGGIQASRTVHSLVAEAFIGRGVAA